MVLDLEIGDLIVTKLNNTDLVFSYGLIVEISKRKTRDFIDRRKRRTYYLYKIQWIDNEGRTSYYDYEEKELSDMITGATRLDINWSLYKVVK